jgi:hypothetical protein
VPEGERTDMQAVERGWGLSDEQKAQIRDRLLAIVAPPTTSDGPTPKVAHRLAISAARALTALARAQADADARQKPTVDEAHDLRVLCRDAEIRRLRRMVADLESRHPTPAGTGYLEEVRAAEAARAHPDRGAEGPAAQGPGGGIRTPPGAG